MKIKEFVRWCNDRAADGCWEMLEALACINILQEVREQKPWKREKFWKEKYCDRVVSEIVSPINKKIKELRMMQDEHVT